MNPAQAAHCHGFILAGGSGTRLWPLSTKDHPKQFLSLDSQGSLIRQTYQRLSQLIPKQNIWVICGQAHAMAAAKELNEIPKEQILAEPQAKNTLGAISLAALHVEHRDPEGLMLILPADHWVPADQTETFCQDLELALAVAREQEALVTFGIQPDYAATGFGYLEQGESFELSGQTYYRVQAFHEKPNLTTAQQYLKAGKYFWNSGMFAWRAQTFLNQLARCQPKTHELFQELSSTVGSSTYPIKLKETFAVLESISVDYGVMEKAERVLMVPTHFSWNDVGNLAALAEVLQGDPDGNVLIGDCLAKDSKNNLVVSREKPVALLGVENLAVIEGKGALLVLPKDRAEDVKKMVERLKELGRDDLL